MENTLQQPEREISEGIALCQQILRYATGVILAAFILIILLTTISTGPFVQMAGKALYYVIVVDALISLITWFYRTRLEKRMSED